MKVGDKVRFLDAVGGGIVTSINGNDCMVEDEDGFEIPSRISQCVVVTDEDDARAAGHAPVHQAPPSQSAIERVKPSTVRLLPTDWQVDAKTSTR